MATMKKQNETKCRPSLSVPQISYLLRLVRADYNKLGTDEAAKLIKVLAPILAKAELLPTQSGNTSNNTNHINTHTPQANTITTNTTSYASKEEYWEACFNLVTQNPTTYLNVLSAEELNAAYEHMYLNNYFTAREVRLFEAGECMSNFSLAYIDELLLQAEAEAEQSNNPKHSGTVDYDNYDGDDSFMRDLI